MHTTTIVSLIGLAIAILIDNRTGYRYNVIPMWAMTFIVAAAISLIIYW